MRSEKRLGRLLRVRSLQRDLAMGEEARAAEQAANQSRLVERIATLAEHVSPGVGTTSALDLAASAVYRNRLQRSHADAAQRLSTAEALLERREEASREARRDHRAIEKLVEAAKSREVLAEMRRLSEGPFGSKRGTALAASTSQGRRDDE